MSLAKQKYSRAGFKKYLKHLEDKPFCSCGKCPITQWMLDSFGLAVGCIHASFFDKDLADRIDLLIPPHKNWEYILPSQILQIIEEMK